MHIRTGFLLVMSAFFLCLHARANDAARAWVQERGAVLDFIEPGEPDGDLEFLRELVGDARVVSFGEAIHGGHEFLAFRNRLFEYLVEKLGFTAIAVETDFVDGTAVDDYVAGGGELTPALVAGVFSFGAPDAAEENRQLLEWMRRHNARPNTGRRLRFYGLDMMGRAVDHEQPIVDRPLNTALRYVAGVDVEQAHRFEQRVGPVLRLLENGRVEDYFAMDSAQRDAYTAAVADLAALFERRRVQWAAATSVPAYERNYRSVLNARALDADMRANGWWICDEKRGPCDIDQRDATAARNLQWALNEEGEKGRILLFEHNDHVRKCVADGAKRGNPAFASLGQHLGVSLGADMVVIGSSVGRLQSFRDQENVRYRGLAPVMAGTQSVTAVNLRALPSAGPVASWWHRVDDESQVRALDLVECFDALIFFPSVTPWHASRSDATR